MRASVYSGIVAVWLLLLGVVSESLFRGYVIPIPNSEPHRISLLFEKDLASIALGDSHIRRGFIASDEFVNLGLGGTTIPAQYYITQFIIKKRVPKHVILEAAPQFFAKINLDKGAMNYESYLRTNAIYPWFFEPGITQYINRLHSWDDLKKLFRKQWINELNRDSMWPKYSDEVRLQKAKNRVSRHRPAWNRELTEIYMNLYERMVLEYVEKGSQVCILRTPVDENYLGLIEGDMDFERAYEFFRGIATKYNVKYVDFRETGIEFTIDKFLNQDHLAPQFSKEFSKRVNKLCFGGNE